MRNMFKTTIVKLHPLEKGVILLGTLLVSIIFTLVFFETFDISQGKLLQRLGASGFLIAGFGYPILTYLTLTGQGLCKIKKENGQHVE